MERLLRSMLFIPSYNEKFIDKAITCDADALIFDMEDSVPESKEEEARCLLKKYLLSGKFDGKEVYLRVNELGSKSLMEDLKLLDTLKVKGLVIPKINSKEDVDGFEKLVSMEESQNGLAPGTVLFLPLIETAAAVMNINSISSCNKRIIALLFGGEDYLDSVWGKHLEPPEALNVPRAMVVMAARMNGLLPIDTPYLDLKNEQGFKEEEKKSAAMGFAGVLLVTPAQIPWANECFSPLVEEVEHAKAVLEAVKEVGINGGSIAKLNGKMIGPPMRKRAEKVMQINQLIEEKKNGKQA